MIIRIYNYFISFFLLYRLLYLFNRFDIKNTQQKVITKDVTNKDDAYNLVKGYLSNTDDGEFNAGNYFTNFHDSLNVPVDSITTRTKNRTGTMIEKFNIPLDSFIYVTKVGNITYWKYDNHYQKNDTSHIPPIFNGIIVTKVGINDENKITSIQEIDRRDTTWSDKMK